MTEIERDVLRLLEGSMVRGIAAERVSSVRDLVMHGEVGIAVENLCENLFESAVATAEIDTAWLSALEEIIGRIGLDERYARLVRAVAARGTSA
jgi:hypothetical protein